jgi:hypothetical protein
MQQAQLTILRDRTGAVSALFSTAKPLESLILFQGSG